MAEAALVIPVFCFMILATVYGGLSIFRYQQCAEVAREAARWASVHGASYAKDNAVAIATPTTVFDNAMKKAAVSFDQHNVTISGAGCSVDPFKFNVTWSDPKQKVGSTVTVTVSYRLYSDIVVSSTSKMVIAY